MNWIDKAVGLFAPGTGLRRARARAAMSILQRGYEGARVGRRTDGWRSDVVWGIITSNPAMGDNKALFHAGHKNLAGTGSGLTVANLGVGLDGKTILNVRPSYLVVPSTLELTAEQIIAQNLVPAKSGNVVPQSIRSLAVIAEPRLIRTFDEGAVIKSKSGLWLSIPTKQAPKRGVGGKRINPSNFPEHRFGKLRFVYRRGRTSLLVVDGVRINRSGRTGRRAKGVAFTKTGRMKQGMTTVVMFIMVPQVRLKKRLDVKREIKRWEGRLPGLISQALQ